MTSITNALQAAPTARPTGAAGPPNGNPGPVPPWLQTDASIPPIVILERTGEPVAASTPPTSYVAGTPSRVDAHDPLLWALRTAASMA